MAFGIRPAALRAALAGVTRSRSAAWIKTGHLIRATVAIGLTKRCIHAWLAASLVESMEREALALELSSRSRDFREGLAAFQERRAPKFEGR